jgi:hypothetical protein
MGKLGTTEDFKNKIFNKFNGKVEILSEYLGGTESIKFVYHCEKHGDTYSSINAKNISSNKTFQPCTKCMAENKRKRNYDPDVFLKEMSDIAKSNDGKLLSDKWVKSKHKYLFKCVSPEHPVFELSHDALVNSKRSWCPYCAGRYGDFNSEIQKIVKDNGGELITEYNKMTEHVKVRCIKHDYVWDILPLNIKKGRWCYICHMSYSEKVPYNLLIDNGYTVKPQFGFDDLKGGNGQKLKYDFAVLNGDKIICLVEIDDNEHRHNHSGLSKRSRQRVEAQARDAVKTKYCTDNNIHLIRVDIDTYSKYYKDKKLYRDYMVDNLLDQIREVDNGAK